MRRAGKSVRHCSLLLFLGRRASRLRLRIDARFKNIQNVRCLTDKT